MRRQRRRRTNLAAALVLGLVLALPLAGCAGGDTGPETAPDRVRAVVLPYLTMVPFHIAAEEGYFAEQNLDVEFLRLESDVQLMTVLARGDVDVSAGFLTVNVLNQVAMGERVRLVAALGHAAPEHCAFQAIIARREHLESGALDDPARIRQLRMDTDVLLPLGYWLDVFVRPFGLTIDDLDLVRIPPAAALEALANGTLDVTMEAEPLLGRHLATGEAIVWSALKDVLPGYQISMLMYGPTILDDRPEVGERFAVAMVKAVRRLRLGKTPRNLAIVERATGLEAREVADACWPAMSEDARIDSAVLRGFQEWVVGRGYVDRVLEDDELYDHRFIDHANVALAGDAESGPAADADAVPAGDVDPAPSR